MAPSSVKWIRESSQALEWPEASTGVGQDGAEFTDCARSIPIPGLRFTKLDPEAEHLTLGHSWPLIQRQQAQSSG